MYNYNLLISYKWRFFGEAKKEALALLKEFGDPNPVIEKTIAAGIAGVKTKLNNREVIKKIKELFKVQPLKIDFTIKWVPVDNWCLSNLKEMKKAIDKIKDQIKPGEKWAMKIEKRRYTKHHTIEIIEELAKEVTEKVDLSNPGKILRIEIIGSSTGISIIKPNEIFSIAKD